jgi:hypothetical protein
MYFPFPPRPRPRAQTPAYFTARCAEAREARAQRGEGGEPARELLREFTKLGVLGSWLLGGKRTKLQKPHRHNTGHTRTGEEITRPLCRALIELEMLLNNF